MSFPTVRKVEDFVCRINVLFSPVSSHGLFSITVTCVEVAVRHIAVPHRNFRDDELIASAVPNGRRLALTVRR